CASLDDGIAIFKNDPLLFKPGAYYFYSSYAVNLLQGVIEKAGGMPFEDFLRQHVWAPAGMLSTALDRPERIVPHRARSYRVDKGQMVNEPFGDVTYKFAGGGMISTVEDLVRLGSAFNHGSLLKPTTVALMMKSQLDGIPQFRENGALDKPGFEQALMWRVQHDAAGRRFIYHCGSVKAFVACLVNFPDQDLVIALAANSSEGPGYRPAVEIAQYFLERGR